MTAYFTGRAPPGTDHRSCPVCGRMWGRGLEASAQVGTWEFDDADAIWIARSARWLLCGHCGAAWRRSPWAESEGGVVVRHAVPPRTVAVYWSERSEPRTDGNQTR